MSPRILSSKVRMFCNPVTGTGAPQPSMAMEGRRRTGGGQKQSRHRGCVVGDKKERKNPLGNLQHKVQNNMCPSGRRRARALPPLQPEAPCCVQMHREFSPASLRRQMICLNTTANKERESKRGREKERERGSCRQHYEKATHQ